MVQVFVNGRGLMGSYVVELRVVSVFGAGRRVKGRLLEL